MKKVLYKYYIIICTLFLVACEGEFIPKISPYITLQQPEGKCETGSIDLQNENRINITFDWQTQNADFGEGKLKIFERATGELISQTTVSTSDNMAVLNLERGKWFTWQIVSPTNNTNDSIPSDKKDFYSELIAEESAPFPVIIEMTNLEDKWVFQWESPEAETNDKIKYKAFFTKNPVEKDAQVKFYELSEDDFQEYPKEFSFGDFDLAQEQPKDGLSQGDYFFKINAIYQHSGTDLITSTYFRVNIPN